MANTKKTIKKVCINLFYKMGYFACGISDIARAARIQKSSIYYHYSNKEEILFDILKTTMADLIENLDSRLKDVKNTKERLRAAIRTHMVSFHRSAFRRGDCPDLYRFDSLWLETLTFKLMV